MKNNASSNISIIVDNIQDYSDRICRNWLKAHKTKPLCSKSIQRYTKIVILLQDIVELIEKITTVIQCAKSQKLQIHQTVCTIVSSCLDIDPQQVTYTTNLVNDLGMDSLSWKELLITLEERFSIEISDEIAGTLSTVQQITEGIVLIVREENKLLPQM